MTAHEIPSQVPKSKIERMFGCESAATALRLKLEPRERIRIGGEGLREDLDGPVDLSHPACAER